MFIITFGISTAKSKFPPAGARIYNKSVDLSLIINDCVPSEAQTKPCSLDKKSIIFVFEPTKLVKTALWRREVVS